MTRAGLGVSVALALLLVTRMTAAQTAPVEVRTSMSRTAVWVGDRAVYTVEVRCAPQVDVLLDDLAVGRLRIDGGDIVSVEEDHQDGAEGTIRRFRYSIVTYRVDVTEIQVAAVPVRYFVRRAGGVQGAPAGQVIVPAAVVAVRSVIPDVEGVPAPRVPATLRPAPRYLGIAQSAGLVVIALAIVPLLFWSADLTGRARRAWDRFRDRRNRPRPRESLNDLRAASFTSDAERIDAFGRLNTIVREHLTQTTGLAAEALTPSELRAALERKALQHTEVVALLNACEHALYAPDPPGADAWHDALRDAQQIVQAGRR
jgi:hypothetical protein